MATNLNQMGLSILILCGRVNSFQVERINLNGPPAESIEN